MHNFDFKNSNLTRRQLLCAARGMAGAALFAPLTSKLAIGHTRFNAYPFTLGVASGDPVADGFVLWTRLAPYPLEGGGMSKEVFPVRWEVASDQRFLNIVKRGDALAAPEFAHSVHVDVSGLEADRWYFYRFIAGGEASPIGRTRTFPAFGAPKDRLRFAFTSCQHFGQGHFTGYDGMMRDDLDLIIHLGDYIYESDWGAKVRFHRPEPITLDEYRNHHALYKSDIHLQAAHAWHPFAVTWDDHEVDNDYAGENSEEQTPPEEFLKRRAAAYRAYYEHMPVRATARPDGPALKLNTTLTFGDLAEIYMLDTRQFRTDQACQGPDRFGGQRIENCSEREDAARTMLGDAQERWLFGKLKGSNARWKTLAQSMLMAQVDQKKNGGEVWWSDGWDGYPAARQRLLSHIQDNQIENAVVIGGDVHSFFSNDLKLDFGNPASKTVASEFVTTSMSSAGISYDLIAPLLPENPHIRFFESRERGYTRVEVTPKHWRTDFQTVSTVLEPEATVATLKSYVVETGKAGVEQA